MKLLTLGLLLLGCSGPAFTEQELYAEGNNTSALGESSGGDISISGQDAGNAGGDSGGMAANPSTSGSGGASAMAGGPPMGEGGTGGGELPRVCLANHQTLECARVCNSMPACQAILDCFVQTNSNSPGACPGISDTGYYPYAIEAERNCCHD